MFETESYSLNSIFFADDSIIVARTLEEARRNLGVVKRVSGEFGLEINEIKSKVMIFRTRKGKGNNGRDPTEVDGMEVVRGMQYLGVHICDEKDIFKVHKEKMIERAEEMSLQTYSIIERCCNRVVMGKTFWKTVVLSSVLSGVGLLTFTKNQIGRLQRIEHGVYRKILGARKFAPRVVLRGEIGASSMSSRIKQSKLLLIKSIIEGRNELMKIVLDAVLRDESSAMNAELKKTLQGVGMSFGDLVEMDKLEIKKRITERDTEEWKSELRSKKTLDLYQEFKGEMREEKVYYNDFGSKLLFAARANTLDLNEMRGRWKKGSASCDLCGGVKEDLEHFVLKCPILENKRREVVRKFKRNGDRDTLGALLFETGGGDCEEVKAMLRDLWGERSRVKKGRGGRG